MYRRRRLASWVGRPPFHADTQSTHDAHKQPASPPPVDAGQALRGLSYALREAVSLIELLQQTVDTASAVYPESRLMIVLHQRDDTPTVRVADSLQTVLFMNLLLEKAEFRALAARAKETMQPILATPSAPTAQSDKLYVTTSRSLNVRSAILAPLVREGQLLGLLMAVRLSNAQAYQPADVQFFEQLLSVAEGALLRLDLNLGDAPGARQSPQPGAHPPASLPSPDSSEYPPGP